MSLPRLVAALNESLALVAEAAAADLNAAGIPASNLLDTAAGYREAGRNAAKIAEADQ